MKNQSTLLVSLRSSRRLRRMNEKRGGETGRGSNSKAWTPFMTLAHKTKRNPNLKELSEMSLRVRKKRKRRLCRSWEACSSSGAEGVKTAIKITNAEKLLICDIFFNNKCR